MTATEAIWHDVECGGYDADLILWEELAERRGGPVLELGCGTGRVTLHLARRGHEAIGLDRDPHLIGALAERAAADPAVEARVQTLVADARDFSLPEPVALVLAPMQLLQLLPGSAERLACLRRVASSLHHGGLLAAAIVEDVPGSGAALPPLPDVRELEGWIYSSLPVAVRPDAERIVLRRLRQTVAPDGALSEAEEEIQLRTLSCAGLEVEARRAGFAHVGRRAIPATDAHVGSRVVLLEKGR